MINKGKKEMRTALSVVGDKCCKLRDTYSSKMSMMQGSSLYYCTAVRHKNKVFSYQSVGALSGSMLIYMRPEHVGYNLAGYLSGGSQMLGG